MTEREKPKTCIWAADDQQRAVKGEHVVEHQHIDDCAGCKPCPEDHCTGDACRGRNHARVTCAECITTARDDLTAIVDICDGHLVAEALSNRIGSEAMVMLGPAAHPEAWRNRAMSAMRGRVDAAYLEDNRDEPHPLWILTDIENEWRDALDQPTDLLPRLDRAADYINRQMHVIADMLQLPNGEQAPEFAHAAKMLRQCRAHLEAVIHDNDQTERSKVACPHCEKGVLLVKDYGGTEDDDGWLCPRCETPFTEKQYAWAKHLQLDSEGAARFVPIADALGVIKPRPEQSLRNWIKDGRVLACCDWRTHRLLVWWPDVRRVHEDTPTRNRSKSA